MGTGLAFYYHLFHSPLGEVNISASGQKSTVTHTHSSGFAPVFVSIIPRPAGEAPEPPPPPSGRQLLFLVM